MKRKHEHFFRDNFGNSKYQVSKVIPLPVKRLKYIQNCVEFVAVNGNAFTILNQSGMRNLMQNDFEALKFGGYGSGLGSPNYTAIKKHIKYLSGAIVKKVKTEVHGAFISVMADTATRFNRSILGLSIQYMYCGQLKIRAIGMINMTVPHTAENLMNAIIKQLKLYEIETHQILSITTDHANNMTAMVMNIYESNKDRSAENFGNVCESENDDVNEDDGSGNDDNDMNSDSDYEFENETTDPLCLPNSFFEMLNANELDAHKSNALFQIDEADDFSETDSDDIERRQEVDAILNECDVFEHILKELYIR